jgi:hypothetical protein
VLGVTARVDPAAPSIWAPVRVIVTRLLPNGYKTVPSRRGAIAVSAFDLRPRNDGPLA